jgi:hypothetical protein
MSTFRAAFSSVLASLAIVLLALGSLVLTRNAAAEEPLTVPSCSFPANCTDQNGSQDCYDVECGYYEVCNCYCDTCGQQCCCYIDYDECDT